MSIEKINSNPAGPDSLENRIQMLRKQIEGRTRIKVRRQRWFLMLGFAMVVACSFGLARLTSQTRQLDADALTQIGRIEIEKHLPDTREVLQAYLEDEAPRLVGDSYQAVLGALPNIRTYFMDDLSARIEGLNHEFEEKLTAQMADKIRLSKEKVEREYPDASDKEKLEYFVADVSEGFNQSYREAIDALYHDYTKEMRETTGYIARLHRSETSDLTKEEQIKKEIIQTMVEIMRRENEDTR